METQQSTLDQLTTGLLQREAMEKQALSLLLDRYTNLKDKIFVQSAEMGGTESYLGAVTLEWFAERVRFASQLPLFRDFAVDSKTKRIVIDQETINEVIQRPIDYSRQSVLAQYLAARPKHKFPPVLVVITQGWVDDRESDEWGGDGLAIKSSAEYTALDSSGKYGLLDVSDTMQIFALDGQHRLLGIQGLMELIKKGELQVLNKNGEAKKGTFIKVEDLEEQFGVNQSELQQLGKELIGVEFISSVVPGETRAEAKRRVRSIFVHVNKMANPLTAGQMHQLDEDNGFALVAKQIATNHPYLTGGDGRVNWDNNTISVRAGNFTTLQALTEMAAGYLGHKYSKWDPSNKGLIPLRPDDLELADGKLLFSEYLDSLVELPSIKRSVQGTSIQTLRNFEKEGGEGILLYRPVGQTALATAVNELLLKGQSISNVFSKLHKFDENGGFSAIDMHTSIWYGVLYDPNKQRMMVSGEKLAVRLLVYLLGGGIANEEERNTLREDLAEAREVDKQYRLFDGTFSTSKSDIKLPNPV